MRAEQVVAVLVVRVRLQQLGNSKTNKLYEHAS